jgi:hypothetical protein
MVRCLSRSYQLPGPAQALVGGVGAGDVGDTQVLGGQARHRPVEEPLGAVVGLGPRGRGLEVHAVGLGDVEHRHAPPCRHVQGLAVVALAGDGGDDADAAGPLAHLAAERAPRPNPATCVAVGNWVQMRMVLAKL